MIKSGFPALYPSSFTLYPSDVARATILFVFFSTHTNRRRPHLINGVGNQISGTEF